MLCTTSLFEKTECCSARGGGGEGGKSENSIRKAGTIGQSDQDNWVRVSFDDPFSTSTSEYIARDMSNSDSDSDSVDEAIGRVIVHSVRQAIMTDRERQRLEELSELNQLLVKKQKLDKPIRELRRNFLSSVREGVDIDLDLVRSAKNEAVLEQIRAEKRILQAERDGLVDRLMQIQRDLKTVITFEKERMDSQKQMGELMETLLPVHEYHRIQSIIHLIKYLLISARIHELRQEHQIPQEPEENTLEEQVRQLMRNRIQLATLEISNDLNLNVQNINLSSQE